MKIIQSVVYAIIMVFVLTGVTYSQAKTKIAVLNFEAKNINQESADAVSDILSTELFNTNRFQVVERQAILQMLEEQKLQMAGVTDMDQAVQIGKILNVEKIMIGSVSKLGQTYIINTRLVDVETGALELAENMQCTGGEGQLPSAIADLVREISQKIKIEGSIIKITGKNVLVDIGESHGVRRGQELEIIRIGDVVTNLSGAVIGKTEDFIGTIKITKVNAEYSEARILGTKTNLRLGDVVRFTSTPITSTPPPIKKDPPKRQYKVRTEKKEKKQVEPPPVF